MSHPAVNTVQRLFTAWEFLVELVVPESRAVDALVTRLHAVFGVEDVRLLWVREDLVREGYLTDAVRYPGLTGVPTLEPTPRREPAAAAPSARRRGGGGPMTRVDREVRRLLAAYTDDDLVTLMRALVAELRPEAQSCLRAAMPARPGPWSRRLWLREEPAGAP